MNPTDRILTGAEPDADARLLRDIRDAQPVTPEGDHAVCPDCMAWVTPGDACFNCEGDA